MAKELELTKKAHSAILADLNKAKESLMKAETVTEVAKMKEGQLLKDQQAFDRQINNLSMET